MERAAMGARSAVRGTPVTHARARVVVASRARQARRVTAQATEVAVLNESGEKSGTATLDLKSAGESSKGLVHRYVVHVLRNQRQGTSSTLTRGEVRGGGRKPYPQKGTGSARRGTKRSPLIPGGGIIFGPKPRDYSAKMNKKERQLAMATALDNAAANGAVSVVSLPSFEDRKTKTVVSWLASAGVGAGEKALVITKEQNEGLYLGGRNIPGLVFNTQDSIHIYDLLNADHVLIEEAVVPHLQERYGA